MDNNDVTPDLPEVPDHYTGIEGLEGIWNGSALWSTEAFYLNDTRASWNSVRSTSSSP